MPREKIVGLLLTVSVCFVLWGVLHLIVGSAILMDPHDPVGRRVALFVLALIYSSACILLGILSWRRADRFRSSWDALLLLIARITSFFIAYIWVVGIGAQFEVPRASTLRMYLYGVIGAGALAYFFFRLTVTLTLLNKEESYKTQDLPNITSRSSVNRADVP